MINYFTLTESRITDDTYNSATPAEKLFIEHIVSQVQLRGPFYQSDLEVAVTLGLSEDKVRRARRHYGRPTDRAIESARSAGKDLQTGCGFILYDPGFKRAGARTGLATRYLTAPIAEVPEHGFYAQIHRYTFEQLLTRCRSRMFTHADVVVWLALAYCFWRFRGKDDNGHRFFVTKEDLRRLSGVPTALVSVERLYRGWIFTGDRHLFEFADQHQRIVFTQWVWCADPSEDEGARRNHELSRRDIAAEVKRRKCNRRPTLRKAVRR